MLYRTADPYYGMFCTQRFDSGASADADSTPVATANRNGADDAGFSLTVARIDLGRYLISGVIPAGYAAGDSVQVSVAASVAGVAAKAVVDQFQIVAVDLNDPAGAGLTDLAAVKGKTDNLPADPATATAQTEILTQLQAISNPQSPGVTLASTEYDAIADAVLQRDVANVEATAAEHSLCFVVLAMSESNTTTHANKLTVFQTDGTTEFVQKAIASDATAVPITGVS
jgi:hypothetical protein